MRYFFLFLLALNIIYLIYNLNHKTEAAIEKKVLAKNSIVLYSESTADHRLKENRTVAENKIDSEMVTTKTVLTEDLHELQKHNIQDDELSNDKNIEDFFTRVESQSKSIIKNDEQLTQTKTNSQIPLNCFIIGPTLHKKKLDKIKNDITEIHGSVNFLAYEQKGITFYRIFIPPLNTRPEIKKAQKMLNDNNLRDHYVMNSEGRKNAIALGVFRVKQIADNIAEEVKNLGYPAVVESMFEPKKTQFFLKITTSDKQKNLNLTKENLNTDLEINLCKKI